jgi:hypothetical protein
MTNALRIIESHPQSVADRAGRDDTKAATAARSGAIDARPPRFCRRIVTGVSTGASPQNRRLAPNLMRAIRRDKTNALFGPVRKARSLGVPCVSDHHAPASQRRHAVGCRGADRWAVVPLAERCSSEPWLGLAFGVSMSTLALWRSARRGRAVLGHDALPTVVAREHASTGHRRWSASASWGVLAGSAKTRPTHHT